MSRRHLHLLFLLDAHLTRFRLPSFLPNRAAFLVESCLSIDRVLLRPDGHGRLHVIEVTQGSEERRVLGTLGRRTSHVDEVVREAEVEVVALVELGNVLGRELEAERFDVELELLDAVAADHGEDVGCLDPLLPDRCRKFRESIAYLLEDVRKRDGCDGHALALCDLVCGGRDLRLTAGEHVGGVAAALLGRRVGGANVAGAEHAEGVDGHALVPGHGDDVAL